MDISSNNNSVILNISENERSLLCNYRKLSDKDKGRFYGRLETLHEQELKQQMLEQDAYCKKSVVQRAKGKAILKSSLTEDENAVLSYYRSISSDRQLNALDKLNELLAKKHAAKIILLKR